METRRPSPARTLAFFLVSFVIIVAALAPLDAFSQDATVLLEKLDAAKVGTIATADFASYLLAEAESGDITPSFVSKAFSEVPDLPHAVAELLPQRVSAALADTQASANRGLWTLAEGLENTEPGVALKTKRLFELAEKADKLLEQGNAAELLKLEETAGQAGEKAIVASRLAKASATTQRDLESTTDPYEALRRVKDLQKVLSGEKLSATVEKFVMQIDTAMQSGSVDADKWPFDDETLVNLVRVTAASRPGLKAALARIYERRLLNLMAANTTKGLSETYSALLENRPDPNEANDALRLKIVTEAKTPEMKDFASGRLEELRYAGRLSNSDKIKLMLAGHYGKKLPIFFGVSILVILIFAALMFIRPRFIAKVSEVVVETGSRRASSTTSIKRPPQEQKPQGPMTPEAMARAKEEARLRFEQERAEEEADKKRFFKKKKKEKYVPGYMRNPDEQDDEYTRLLAFFGLEEGASEGEIKKAYRERVKNLHPDAKPGEVNTQDQDFIELKEMYDRLIEVRKSWFGKK